MSNNDNEQHGGVVRPLQEAAACTPAPPTGADQDDDDRDFNPFAIEELPDDSEDTDSLLEELGMR